MGPLGRRLRALERRVGTKEFRAGAPPLDPDGLPNWDDTPPLSIAGYMKAMGSEPDSALTEAELAARERLSPYRATFEKLHRDANEKEAGP